MVQTLGNGTERALPTSDAGHERRLWAFLGRLSVGVTVLGAAAWAVLGALALSGWVGSSQVVGIVAAVSSPVAVLLAVVTLIGTSVRHTHEGRRPAWLALGVNGIAMIVGFLVIVMMISAAVQPDVAP